MPTLIHDLVEARAVKLRDLNRGENMAEITYDFLYEYPKGLHDN